MTKTQLATLRAVFDDISTARDEIELVCDELHATFNECSETRGQELAEEIQTLEFVVFTLARFLRYRPCP